MRWRGCSPRAATRFDAVRADYNGRPGHPVVLERGLFPRLTALRGDAGAREVLAGARVCRVPCEGLGRPDDIDTRDELEVAGA